MMQQQYWLTKKSVLRKLGGKEDDCIVSSDAELDAKLELFKSINDSCIQLQRVIDVYQERLCNLVQEENALGRYLKDCGKNEKNSNAGQIMTTAGKALSYTSHQRLTIRPPLVRLHHEVETFRGRAIQDTRVTVMEMEKVRTEYRAALSWMKSTSQQLDPDSGLGLERFRKAQSYVKTSKTKFDRLTLACLQKVDLLAAARCNMFSHALVPYQNALLMFATKAAETLTLAATKLENVEPPYEFNVVSELAATKLTTSSQDRDKNTFFNAEYTDGEESTKTDNQNDDDDNKTTANNNKNNNNKAQEQVTNLLGEDFSSSSTTTINEIQSGDNNVMKNTQTISQELFDLNCWPNNSEFIGGDFMPSRFLQEGHYDFNQIDLKSKDQTTDDMTTTTTATNPRKIAEKTSEKNQTQMSWLSLFAELDPLANPDQDDGTNNHGDRA